MEINEEVSTGVTFPSNNEAAVDISILVCPTTGGQFNISISPQETVEKLRKKIGRHLQTPHERLNILFKEKVLSHGKISEHNVQDGSKLTLLPLVESGFSSTVQGTQQSIIQAIESLSDVQIDDFLSGRSPLTLALRVGDHMMFVQLQLEQSVAGTSQAADALSRSLSTQRQQLYEQTSDHCSSSASLASHHPSTKSSSASTKPFSAADGPKGKGQHHNSEVRTSPLDRLAGLAKPYQPSHPSGKQARNPSETRTPGNDSSQRKASTTCGKITSGVGPLSHHGASGSRVVRQMQRLRRLCGAHQQCVVYSNRELASEISSIVHAAKHLSEPGTSGSGRRSSKNSTRDRAKASTSQSVPASTQPSGASIDSVTTHGPGIFSGTFSGSLHPNIQDSDGRPKRDPQTILQILTDLLSATNHYEGQTGSIGMLPQLFKEHFNKQSMPCPSSSHQSSSQEKQSPRHHKHSAQRRHPAYPAAFNSSHAMRMSMPYHPYSHMLSCGEASPFHAHGQHGSRKSSSAYPPITCWEPWYSHTLGKRAKKQAPTINLPRLHQLRQENGLTRHKMHLLREEMRMRRMRRQSRRDACGPYPRQHPDESQCLGRLSVKQSVTNDVEAVATRDIDMDIDDLREYAEERKADVTHESPETVIV